MITVKVKAQDLSDIPLLVQRGAKTGLREALDLIKRDIQNNMPVASGTARQSIVVEIKASSEGVSGEITAMGSARDYVSYIEFGRTPGAFPPRDRIEKWLLVSNKGRAYVAAIAKRYRLTGERALRAATFLKSRAIARLGTRGALVFSKAWQRGRRRIEPYIRNAIRRTLARRRR